MRMELSMDVPIGGFVGILGLFRQSEEFSDKVKLQSIAIRRVIYRLRSIEF